MWQRSAGNGLSVRRNGLGDGKVGPQGRRGEMIRRMFRSVQERWHRRPPTDPEWPDDGSWMGSAQPCPEFRLDAGYAVTHYVPGWLLPVHAPNAPPISLPKLPRTAGHVLTVDTIGREAELVRHFAQLPPLPDPVLRRETAAWSCLEVNLLLCPPGEHPVVADTFGPSRAEADRLLAELADTDTPPAMLYDNLDQGWALRVVVEPEEVFVLDWAWDAPDPRHGARSLRLPRPELARQAAAARERLQHLHETLVGALGRDIWTRPIG